MAVVALVCLAAGTTVLVLRDLPTGPGPSVATPAGSAGDGASGSASGTPSAGSPPASSGAAGADPAQAAARWLSGRSPQGGTVAVDPSLYDDVAGASALASRLVPADTAAGGGGGGTTAAADGGGARWLVAGPELRADAAPGSWAAQALAASSAVAVFGEGDDRVEVRELAAAAPGATVTSASPRATATAASEESLQQLADNPRLDFSPRARRALSDGSVDLRLAALLVQLSSAQPLSVADLPSGGAAEGTEPVRTVVLDGVDGRPVGADPEALQVLQRQLSAQDEGYRATATQQDDAGTAVLRLVLPPAGA